MLNLNKVCSILLIISFLFCCTPNKKKEDLQTTNRIIDFTSLRIGEANYWKIHEMMLDSISNWERNGLPSWRIDSTTVEFEVDSVFCINKNLDKIIAAHLGRQLLSSGTLDGIAYLYGVKIEEKWYFFSGPTMYVPRYKEHLYTPTSFTKLHEIAMDNIFKGYLKKNKQSGEWEINEGFFAGMENKNNPEVSSGYGSCFECQSFEEYVLYRVKKNWEKRDTPNYEPLQ